MADIVKALYNCAFSVWNALIGIAMTLFTTSPKTAGGGTPYSVVHTFYNAISDATVPIATVFFIIAIYKAVVSAPPGQQAYRFLQDALRYCIILYIAANMWSIMGYIMTFADGITGKIAATGTYTLSVLRGVMVDSMDEKYAEIFIKGDNTYAIVQPDGKKKELYGADIIERNSESVVDAVAKAAGRKGR